MEFSLDSYRMLGRQCGAAHKLARDTGDTSAATALFATLWQRLDRECLADHCDARATFNAEFARAYRGGSNPPCAAPAPAPAPTSDILQCIHDTDFRDRPAPRKSPASRASVALDCAAFYASKTV